MKNFKIFIFIVISFFFASCGEAYVNMENTIFGIDKKEYKKYEDINIHVCGDFLPQECVIGIYFDINIVEADNKEKMSKFDLIKIDGEEINSTNESYLLYLEENRESYRYQLSCMGNKECITNFDTTVSISLAEVGTYYLSVYCKIISSKRKLGGVKIIEIPFTVYE
ncbi:MAG: hypothetical protein J6R03_04430 [Treponema sp.]|nr:hypothetical protein [Treponema sp.]